MPDVESTYREYGDGLYRYALKSTGSSDDARDVVQDVFLRLADAGDILSIGNVAGWLFRVARNRILDLRKKRREQRIPDDGAFLREMNALLTDDSQSPDKAMMREYIVEALQQALRELPPEQASAYTKTEIEGMSTKEVAAEAGVPQATILSRKHYAVLALRRRLADVYKSIID